MRQRIHAVRTNGGGLSLIELLVVLVVLGALCCIVFYAGTTISREATRAACKLDIATVRTASQAYYVSNNGYPADIGTLVTAGLLKQPPRVDSGRRYTIVYAPSGAVSGYLGAGASGTACLP